MVNYSFLWETAVEMGTLYLHFLHWEAWIMTRQKSPAHSDREGLAGGWGKLWQGLYNFSDSSISYLQTPGLYCPCLGNLQIEITLEDSTFKPDSNCQGCQHRRWGEFIWLIYLNEIPLGIQATLWPGLSTSTHLVLWWAFSTLATLTVALLTL